MREFTDNKKGVALFMVIGTLFITLILASAILSIISSQSRLSRHKVLRIQAYYALLAGINLAVDQLRTGTWSTDTDYCINCTATVPVGNRIIDADIPFEVMIYIGAVGEDPPGSPSAFSACAPITVITTYTVLLGPS